MGGVWAVSKPEAPNPKPCTYRKRPMEAAISFAMTDYQTLNHQMRSMYGTGQAPNNKQAPTTKIQILRQESFGYSNIEHWNLFGICNLRFGI
jgi:hypothetical protein